MNINAGPSAVKQQLVTVLTTAMLTAGADGGPVPVFYAWMPEVTSDCVFLGHPLLNATDDVSSRVPVDMASPVAEATTLGQGTYRIEGTCWSFRPDLKPDQAAAAEARVDGFWMIARRALAPLPWIRSMTAEYQLRPFEAGWAALVAFTVDVTAQLT